MMKTKKIFKQENGFFAAHEFEEEQKRLEHYIKKRPLPRPKTNIAVLLSWILLYLFLGFLSAFAVISVFQIACKWLVYFISYLAFLCLFLKKICIKAIECYQHYAKEETRRKCVCVPSCSEYAVAALKKYHTLKALNKIRIRLFKTCGGYGYVQDDP